MVKEVGEVCRARTSATLLKLGSSVDDNSDGGSMDRASEYNSVLDLLTTGLLSL